MSRATLNKQLLLQKIEAHRALFELESRILRAEIDGHVRPARRALGIFKQLRPLGATLRSGFSAARGLFSRRRKS